MQYPQQLSVERPPRTGIPLAAITGIHSLGAKSALKRHIKALNELITVGRAHAKTIGRGYTLALLAMPVLLWSIGEFFRLTINVGTNVLWEAFLITGSIAFTRGTWKRIFYAWKRDGRAIRSFQRHTRAEFGLIAVCAIAAFCACALANNWTA